MSNSYAPNWNLAHFEAKWGSCKLLKFKNVTISVHIQNPPVVNMEDVCSHPEWSFLTDSRNLWGSWYQQLEKCLHDTSSGWEEKKKLIILFLAYYCFYIHTREYNSCLPPSWRLLSASTGASQLNDIFYLKWGSFASRLRDKCFKKKNKKKISKSLQVTFSLCKYTLINIDSNAVSR